MLLHITEEQKLQKGLEIWEDFGKPAPSAVPEQPHNPQLDG